MPDFGAPPLNEVVLGVQFQPVAGYQQIRAFEVWQLFRDKFPNVSELPPLAPQFETFGLPSAPQFAFNMSAGPVHDRFWFQTEAGNQLLQFQQDRLLHNWRKVHPEKVDYPRFESMETEFEREIAAVESYFKSFGAERLVVTQCELSYLNNIQLGEESARFSPQDWFSFVDSAQPPVDEFFSSVRLVLTDENDQPYGRLYRESATGVDNFGRRVLALNFTARGRPREDTSAGILEFMRKHRHMIAEEFLQATTASAHKIWKRSQ